MRLAVLIACHNRAETTCASLCALDLALRGIADLTPTLFLLDDNSSDDTVARVRAALPDVVIINGSGALFWVGGMHAAYRRARADGCFDAYLLFNDDVSVFATGVAAIFAEYRAANRFGPTLIAGATVSPDGRDVTYAGFRHMSKWRPRAFARISPNGRLQDVDGFNGNFVLVPGAFFERIGGLDPRYTHTLADIDLGLVAKREGVRVCLASETIGACAANARFSETVPPSRRLEQLRHPRRSSNDFLRFCRKHMPPALMPAYLLLFQLKRLRFLATGR